MCTRRGRESQLRELDIPKKTELKGDGQREEDITGKVKVRSHVAADRERDQVQWKRSWFDSVACQIW